MDLSMSQYAQAMNYITPLLFYSIMFTIPTLMFTYAGIKVLMFRVLKVI